MVPNTTLYNQNSYNQMLHKSPKLHCHLVQVTDTTLLTNINRRSKVRGSHNMCSILMPLNHLTLGGNTWQQYFYLQHILTCLQGTHLSDSHWTPRHLYTALCTSPAGSGKHCLQCSVSIPHALKHCCIAFHHLTCCCPAVLHTASVLLATQAGRYAVGECCLATQHVNVKCLQSLVNKVQLYS